MSNQYKIGLIGTPGSGRTTVAFKLSDQLHIPFLSSRAVTQKILERDGYNYDSGVYVENFLAVKHREKELIANKIKSEREVECFITDRTTLEQFAYALLEVEQYEDGEIEKMENTCKGHLKLYSHLFYFKRSNDIKINGVRTTNKFFQMKMDFIITGLIGEWNIPVIEIDSDADVILKYLSENS